jgi:glycine cleavage system H protein
MNVPNDLLYAKTHEWIRRDSSDAALVTVGITDHAQEELTDIVYVELPKVGATVTAAAPAAVVESVKAASDIYAPLSGVVTEVNEALGTNPATVNTDAFGEGWLFKMRMSTPTELEALLTPAAYTVQIGS